MTLYEKNLETLNKYYPQMDCLIKEAQEEMEEEIRIIEEQSDDGETILKIEKEDRVVYLNGKRNAREPAEIWAKTLGELPRNAPVLMVGVGNYFYLKELVENTKNRVAIFVYEPSLQIFLKFLELVDIERWMEKHLIVFWVKGLRGMDAKRMDAILGNILTYEMLNFSRRLVLPNYDLLFPEDTIEFVKMCRDAAQVEAVSYNTRSKFSNVMAKNIFRNVKHLYKGYKTTQLPEVVDRKVPGIVVAAGPSLNKNIQDLKAAKGKAFIIAVDTAIKPLLNAGIVPDMFMIIDALKPLDLVKIEGARNIPLVTTLNAASEVLDYHTGMKIFYNEGYQIAERIFLKSGQKIGRVESGGSVATNAFSLVHKLGIETIILVGQDLAFTNNKSHADGTFKEVMEEVDTSRFIMVEGNYEEKIPTRGDLKLFLDWFNYYIDGCKQHNKNFRVINATEGGAKIDNTEIMTLKDAIRRECTVEVDIEKKLQELSPMLSEENQKWAAGYLAGLSEEYKKLASEARRLQKTYKKLDKICNKRNIDSKEYLSILNKLKKQSKELERKTTYQLIAITMSRAEAILRNEQFLQENSIQKEGKEIARKGILYMENVEQMAEVFSEFAEEVFSDLKEEDMCSDGNEG